MCGAALDEFPLCPGRTGPKLGASLYQLEQFCETCPAFAAGYMQGEREPFQEKSDLFDKEQFPELVPYRSLCANRLRIVGEGQWAMESFLDGILWLPFQEPSFLHHGFSLCSDGLPSFNSDDPDEIEQLALIWDAKNLLALYSEPVCPGLFCRVFNCFKNAECDHQIGDRRVPNLAELHVDGPSKFLPQGHQLVLLSVPKFTQCLRGSMTDRRDFCHQAHVSEARARSNMLSVAFLSSRLSRTRAYADLEAKIAQQKKQKRELLGDGFRSGISRSYVPKKMPSSLHVAFRSLFQGDHLGVEFALRSHEVLLERGGLLVPETRMQGNKPFPVGSRLEALVIADYFAIGAEPLGSDPAQIVFLLEPWSLPERSMTLKSFWGPLKKMW